MDRRVQKDGRKEAESISCLYPEHDYEAEGMKRKRWMIGLLLTGILVSGIPVHAGNQSQAYAEKKNQTHVVILGEDLSEQQKKMVLKYLELSEEELSADNMLTMSGKNLEADMKTDYAPQTILGMDIRLGEPKSGIQVSTDNIQGVTSGTMRNAFLTLGMEDAEVTVAAPYPVSGETALWYAVDGYEKLKGVRLSDQAVNAAWEEVETTGLLEKKTGSDSIAEKLITDIKAKIADGEIKSDDDLKKEMKEQGKKLGLDLTDQDMEPVIELMHHFQQAGLAIGKLAEQAQDIYSQYGTEMIDHPDQAVSSYVKKKASETLQEWADHAGTEIRKTWNSITESIIKKLKEF